MNIQLLNLLLVFLQVGLFSIGGGYATIPLIQNQVVQINHWLTLQEFIDIITISQMTPGPLAVNTSTFVGIRIAGLPGAVIATFGCIISGFLISLLLYRFFQCWKNNNHIGFLLKGLHSVSVGLIGASAATMMALAFWGTSSIYQINTLPDMTAVIIFMICLFLLWKWKLGTIQIILFSGVLGLFLL